MCDKPKGKFNWFDESQLKEVGFICRNHQYPSREDLLKLRDDCKEFLSKRGFIFFNFPPEYRLILRRNGFIKEFGIQYHHINR